ncbi:carbon-nitrogen hydrolase family protein [Vibrio parahaemolyticus]|uniref:carbon-nitrogen hydrolase family protein n=2 Tax=Vibrio parahaemolyticus TaxID=670 RepID=UPI00215C6421|nr:carbon-nitrogen hydrolase family protein [Vibrio parahaemolyticus]MCR9821645.1 carbon-nitrogen hydrolase family protein [Vibrio parahaemolyticus]
MRIRLLLCGAVMLFANMTNASPEPPAKPFTFSAVQLKSSDVGNFFKMKLLASRAKAAGAELVIFPESSVFGWLNPNAFMQAEPIPGKYSEKFAQIASSLNIWVAVGLAERAERAGAGSLPGAYNVYDSGILINPDGEIVLHHRKVNVLGNAFDPDDCKRYLNKTKCSYTPGKVEDLKTVKTDFGQTTLLVCADAYVPGQGNITGTLDRVKKTNANVIIVPWGVTSSEQSQCGNPGFNATGMASHAAKYLSAYVLGSNGTGERLYGNNLPSYYCGSSGFSSPSGKYTESTVRFSEIATFRVTN